MLLSSCIIEISEISFCGNLHIPRFINSPQLEYLHIRIRKMNEKRGNSYLDYPISHTSINQIIFDGKMFSIQTLFLEINNGLSLNKSLISHQNLRNVNLHLQTIDDLFILLDGLIPNVQIMIIQLYKKRILCKLIIEINSYLFILFKLIFVLKFHHYVID